MMTDRAKYILLNNGIEDYRQLASMSWLECMCWDNCAIGTLRELREDLASEGLKFKHDDSLQAWLEQNPPRHANKKLAASLKKTVAPIVKQVTLRDQFAMAALTGIIVIRKNWEDTDIAADAYDIADAMMEERK